MKMSLFTILLICSSAHAISEFSEAPGEIKSPKQQIEDAQLEVIDEMKRREAAPIREDKIKDPEQKSIPKKAKK